jgi:hypothetical protein
MLLNEHDRFINMSLSTSQGFFKRAAAITLLLSQSVVGALADTPLVNPDQRTWRTLNELNASERNRVDVSVSSADGGLSLPEEEWPFEAPFSAQEMGYRVMDFAHISRWSHIFADGFGSITKAGYLSQGITVGMVEQVFDPGSKGQITSVPGDIHQRQIYYYTYPPKNDGLQEMWLMRRTGSDMPTKIDYFAYSPELRRVRRQPSPRRETQFINSVQSFDDITGREAWEFNWRILGADVLYETVRFPITRKNITFANADGGYYDVPVNEVKIMGERYPFYRPDGGIDCFVLIVEPDPDWLPGYKISKLIYWIDQYYFFPLRIEQYDESGDLKTIQVRTARQENKSLAEGYGYTNPITVYYDIQQDLISYSLHDAHLLHEWTEEEKGMFTPDFMRRRWLKYPQQTQSLVSQPEQFYLRPHVMPNKFPGHRTIKIAPDVAQRIEQQEQQGRLVFAGDE